MALTGTVWADTVWGDVWAAVWADRALVTQIPGAVKRPSSTILWSQLVKSAEGKEANRKAPAYQFTGRVFYDS